jgi:hypothetical protein
MYEKKKEKGEEKKIQSWMITYPPNERINKISNSEQTIFALATLAFQSNNQLKFYK